MTEDDSDVFIGPAQTSWIKFKVAGIAWALTRGNPIPYVGYIPGAERVAMWAFKQRVMSRDFEVSGLEDNGDKKSNQDKK